MQKYRKVRANFSVRKVYIFDFDGTLFLTPSAEEGIPYFHFKSGECWPHGKSWWTRTLSITSSYFQKFIIPGPAMKYYRKLRHKLAEQTENSSTNSNSIFILLTGRHVSFAEHLQQLLAQHGLEFDHLICKPEFWFDTLTFKKQVLDTLLLDWYPKTRMLDMYEDRQEHAKEFQDYLNQSYQHVKSRVFLVNPSPCITEKIPLSFLQQYYKHTALYSNELALMIQQQQQQQQIENQNIEVTTMEDTTTTTRMGEEKQNEQMEQLFMQVKTNEMIDQIHSMKVSVVEQIPSQTPHRNIDHHSQHQVRPKSKEKKKHTKYHYYQEVNYALNEVQEEPKEKMQNEFLNEKHDKQTRSKSQESKAKFKYVEQTQPSI